MEMKNILIASVFSLLIIACSAFTKSDGVLIIKGENQLNHLLSDHGILMLAFHQKQPPPTLVKEYAAVAKSMAGIVQVAAMDCDATDNKDFCIKEGILSYPAIKIYGPGTQQDESGKETKENTDYAGVRTSKELSAALTKLLTDQHIQKLKDKDSFDAFTFENSYKPKAVLFTSKTETTNMYKGLSMQLHDGLDFAEVHESAADIVESYGVTDFPMLIVTKSDGSVEVYDGQLKAPAVLTWLSQFSVAPKKPKSDDSTKDDGKKPNDLPLITLDKAFHLDSKEDMHLLGLVGSECTDPSSVSAFSKAVSEMGKIVNASLVLVSASDAEQLNKWGASASKMRGSPCSLQVVLIPFGEDKDHVIYKGELNGKALQSWVTSEMPEMLEHVTVDGMDLFLSSPSPSDSDGEELDEGSDDPENPLANKKIRIKCFLYTDKEEAPGIYKALALNFRDRLSFGFLTSGSQKAAALMAKYKVVKVPTLFLILMVRQAEGWGMQPLPWSGPLKYNEIRSWLDMGLAQLMPKKPPTPDELVPVVVDKRSMEDKCAGKGGLCIIGLLTNLTPSSGPDEKLKRSIISTAAERHEQGQPFSFVLIDASKFRGVATAFGVSRSSELPALVALSGRKMRYASLPSSSSASWDNAAVSSFIDGVLSGKIRTEPLTVIPPIVEGGKALSEDSNEAPDPSDSEPVIEEEFDLGDIMSEEIEDSSIITGDKMKRVEEELRAEQEAEAKKKTSKKKKSKKSKKTEL